MAEWISAKDQTPEPGKTVLCYYQYEISGMKNFNLMLGCYVEGEGWHRVCTSGYHYANYIEPLDVLYWIELPELPSGYTELEYIESSGTQYVDTRVVPNNKGGVHYIDKNRIEAAVKTLRRRTERGEERN